jgi:hypothetical protein
VTGRDVVRLREMRKEVAAMRDSYEGGDAHGRLDTLLASLDSVIEGPEWEVTLGGGQSRTFVRAWSLDQAMAKAGGGSLYAKRRGEV